MRSTLSVALLGISVLAIVGLALFNSISEVRAFGCRPALLPYGTTLGCGTCHFNPQGGGPRNPFGFAMDQAADGCDEFWDEEFAALDSDEDGRTNGEELQDALGAWRPGDPNPGDADAVTGFQLLVRSGEDSSVRPRTGDI